MQRYRINMTDLAAEDFTTICDKMLYLGGGEAAAISRMEGVRKVINTLKGFPERNPLDDDPALADNGVRVICYEDYHIYYVVDNETNMVYILRIIQILSGDVRRILAFPRLQYISMEVFSGVAVNSL